jgi:outer membrane protein assembly factor BamB
VLGRGLYFDGLRPFIHNLHSRPTRQDALRWRANILYDADANLYCAMSASPLVVGNTVVTVRGGGNERSLVASDRTTGRIVWSALDDEAAYSSPMRVTLAGVDQIVVLLGARVVGVSPDRGALLWEFPWPTEGASMRRSR